MRFVRQHRGLGWLALMALVLQLVLSFGHHHDHAAAHREIAASSNTCAPGSADSCPAHDDDDDEHCSICWTMALAAAAVLTFPIVPKALVERAVRTLRPQWTQHVRGSSVPGSFQARAPPV